MTQDSIAIALIWCFVGFQWGGWFQQRKQDKHADPALKLITDLATKIIRTRKIVGPEMTISQSVEFKAKGENYKLVLEAEGRQQ